MNNLDDPEWVEVFSEFAEETKEALERAEATLMAVERDRMSGGAVDPESIAALFRTFHTVKGTAGFLSLEQIVRVAHHAENLLARVRAGELLPSSDHITTLCESVDFLVGGVEHVGRTGEDAALRDRGVPLIETLRRAVEEPSNTQEAPSEAEAVPEPTAPEPTASEPTASEPTASEPTASEPTASEPTAPEPTAPESAEQALQAAVETMEAVVSASPPAPAASAPAESTPRRAAPERREVIRVDAARIDALLNMVGELVIAENMTSREVGEALHGNRGLLQLQRVTRQLQDLTMSIRMVPIRGVFRKMHRLVRDLCQRQGKRAELLVFGEDTEVDKSLVDTLGDPLVHLLRNAIDHGLETPEDRRAAGKPIQGTVRLTASHRGGEVLIEIEDDGRGIDRDKVVQRARERGLLPPNAEPSDADAYQLLFAPGFSTAAQVTDVSGRGVGMDVVKRNIERFNGRVEVTSTLGAGTKMTLRVPLTLAIVDGMLLRIGQQHYTVPMLQVREAVPMKDLKLTDLPGGAELVELREHYVPFLRLGELFGVPVVEDEATAPIVVFIEGAGGLVGILVDDVVGQQQTVIKPMPPMLPAVRAASGCCILGDGQVSLILDANALSSIGKSRLLRSNGGQAA
ncbi:MAG: chemotaxis protein CheA [Sandaracinaceae bacterium]